MKYVAVIGLSLSLSGCFSIFSKEDDVIPVFDIPVPEKGPRLTSPFNHPPVLK